MKISRSIVFVFVATLAMSRAVSADYTGAVLYQLTPPSGYLGLSVGSAAAGQFVGGGSSLSAIHAALCLSDGTFVDLNPSGLTNSVANGTNGTRQVGEGSATNSNYHALLWDGTAASAVDLNPSGYVNSSSIGISPNGIQQVGHGSTIGPNAFGDALLWTGTAASAS